MPHVVVKMYPGRAEDLKQRLADAIARDVMEIAGCDDKAVSVAIEEIAPADWPEGVYRPDILDKKATLYKEPGYDPFA